MTVHETRGKRIMDNLLFRLLENLIETIDKADLPKSPRKFIGDGCSGLMSFFWWLIFGTAPPWEGHCNIHDIAYHRGGPLKYRLLADTRLLIGVALSGHPYWAVIMFIGVRLGGVWWFPFPSVRQVQGKWVWSWTGVRWDYGYSYWQSVKRFWTGDFTTPIAIG